MKKQLTVLVVVGMVVAAMASVNADILEQVLVKVNGDIITKTELEQRQIAALRQKNPNLRPDSDAELQKALADITPLVIVEAVDEMLMVQRGKELGYTMSTEQFTGIVENIKKENKIESDEALQAALKQEGMTMADLRKQLEKNMLFTRVQQSEIMAKLQVTDTELKAYYDGHKDEFATTPQITLRELLVAVPVDPKGLSVAADDDAKAKAEAIRKKLVAGEPFARVAAEVSDSPSKANGGLVGPMSKADLSPELQKAIEGLKNGALTPVLRTQRGYQILKVENVSDTTLKSFEDAKTDIADKIANDKRQGEYVKYIEKLRADAIIDWKNDEIKKAYEIGLKMPRASAQ
ncbi:MAG: peptidylprolyl isomerase [Vicinamibacterales bacterium]